MFFKVPKFKAMPSPGLTSHNHNQLLLWYVNLQKKSLQVWIQSCERIIKDMQYIPYHKCIYSVDIPKVRLVGRPSFQEKNLEARSRANLHTQQHV